MSKCIVPLLLTCTNLSKRETSDTANGHVTIVERLDQEFVASRLGLNQIRAVAMTQLSMRSSSCVVNSYQVVNHTKVYVVIFIDI